MRTHTTIRGLIAVTAAAVAIAAPLAACGDDEESSDTTAKSSTTTTASADVTVDNVWARPGTTGGNSAIYMDITAGSGAEELTKASVPADVAARVELHETVEAGSGGDMSGDMSTTTMGGDMGGGSTTTAKEGMDGSTTTTAGGSGMMTMQPVDKIEIPADSTVKLEQGGLHVMLFELKKDLVAGDTVEVTLSFANAGEMSVTAEVKEP